VNSLRAFADSSRSLRLLLIFALEPKGKEPENRKERKDSESTAKDLQMIEDRPDLGKGSELNAIIEAIDLSLSYIVYLRRLPHAANSPY
jgi:hypothetical protein